MTSLTIPLPSSEATTDLAARIGAHLSGGDCLLLSGPIGAGKSHFARSLILSRLPMPEDVPSPTFTLVQTYDAGVEIWHADLYRLSDPQEVDELGLTEAMSSAICLIEWPDRLGDLAPTDALMLTFEPGPDVDARNLTMTWTADKWTRILTPVAP